MLIYRARQKLNDAWYFTRICSPTSSHPTGDLWYWVLQYSITEKQSAENYLYAEAQNLDHSSEIKVSADRNSSPKQWNELDDNVTSNPAYEPNNTGEDYGDIHYNSKKVLDVDWSTGLEHNRKGKQYSLQVPVIRIWINIVPQSGSLPCRE